MFGIWIWNAMLTRNVNKQCLIDTPNAQKPKRNRQNDGHTDGQCENSIPPRIKFADGIINGE